jgi:peroxiredoxin family protein
MEGYEMKKSSNKPKYLYVFKNRDDDREDGDVTLSTRRPAKTTSEYDGVTEMEDCGLGMYPCDTALRLLGLKRSDLKFGEVVRVAAAFALVGKTTAVRKKV